MADRPAAAHSKPKRASSIVVSIVTLEQLLFCCAPTAASIPCWLPFVPNGVAGGIMHALLSPSSSPSSIIGDVARRLPPPDVSRVLCPLARLRKVPQIHFDVLRLVLVELVRRRQVVPKRCDNLSWAGGGRKAASVDRTADSTSTRHGFHRRNRAPRPSSGWLSPRISRCGPSSSSAVERR